jgi:hypothetical protein
MLGHAELGSYALGELPGEIIIIILTWHPEIRLDVIIVREVRLDVR